MNQHTGLDKKRNRDQVDEDRLARPALWAWVGVLVLGGTFVMQQAEASEPRAVSATATLSILAGSVQHVPAGADQPKAAVNGMAISIGDRVLTGAKATALVTFLDGSTLTVLPDSDVTVKKADIGQKASTVNIHINLGMVWARVVRLADPKSNFALESNTATATVHDGLIGGHQFEDGSFICWTRAGALNVTDRQGRTVVLMPGEKLLVKADQTLAPQTFAPNQSALTITVSAGVLPLVEMPDKARVVGFVSPGVEVNQVFGSLTRVATDGSHVVEVPAGVAGPFTLVLEGQQDGPFTISTTGSFKGAPVYRQELSGTVKKGERASAQITQQIDPATAADPKTAKVLGGSATPVQPLNGPLPGTILLSPTELQTTGVN